jgi:hypothetical protein
VPADPGGERRFAMRGPEITKHIREHLTSDHRFVKMWRKENDFLDYDLVERFMNNITDDEDIGGLDLLTMDEMWDELKRIGGEKVSRIHGSEGDIVGWLHKGKEGLKSYTCDFTPENLMKIYDVETRGNPVH